MRKKVLVVVLAAIGALLLLMVLSGLYVRRHPLAVAAWWGRRSLAAAGFTKIYVENSQGTQAAWQAGSGPALIFLHGLGDQSGTWASVAPAFVKDHRVLLLDLAGHGESAPATGSLNIGDMVDGLTSVLAKQTGPVTIVGNSLGAWVAMLYSIEHPDRVQRIVLLNGGGISGERPDLTLMPANREEARKLFDALMDPGSPRVPDFVLDDVVREAHRGPIARMAAEVEVQQSYLLDDRLQEVKVPVDIVWGEADRMLPVDYARRMQAGLPAARLTIIPRCGHVPQQECPQTLTAALEKVLSQAAPTRQDKLGSASARGR